MVGFRNDATRLRALGRVLVFLVAGSAVAGAQGQSLPIEDLRNAVRDAFNPSQAGKAYAASINFAIEPDIATARFHLDAYEEDGALSPALENSRVPLQKNFSLGRDDLQGFVRGALAYQEMSLGLPVLDATVQSNWRTRGAEMGFGVEYAVSENLKIIPALTVGVADITNRARYNNAAVEEVLQPVLEGIVFDWDARAWVAGVSLAWQYEIEWSGVRLVTRTSAAATRIQSFDASSSDINFDAVASTFDIEFNGIRRIGEIKDVPISLVGILGATSLVGNIRDEFGFGEFAELGVALQFDVERLGIPVDDLRFGVKAIKGPGVSGWALVLGRGL